MLESLQSIWDNFAAVMLCGCRIWKPELHDIPDAWSTITRGDYASMFLAGLFDGHWCWRGGLAVRVSNLFDARRRA